MWVYFYYSKLFEKDWYWYGVSESSKTIFLQIKKENLNLDKLYFVKMKNFKMDLLTKFGEIKKESNEIYGYHDDIAPHDVRRKYGKLYSIKLNNPNDTNVIILNYAFFGIKVLYQSVGDLQHRVTFELMFRQSSEKKNCYGWINISNIVDTRKVQVITPDNIIEYDSKRIPPILIGVSYDIEMSHTKKGIIEHCDARNEEDVINILCAVKFEIGPNSKVIDTIKILNGYNKRCQGDINDDTVTVAKDDNEVIFRFFKWMQEAHFLVGWNISSYDNIQIMRKLKLVQSPILSYINVYNDVDYFIKDEAGGTTKNNFGNIGYRMGLKHQAMIEGQQVASLYLGMKQKNISLDRMCKILEIPGKIDISFKEMEEWYIDWLERKVEYNNLYIQYCENDALAVWRILKNIHLDCMFSILVCSNMELLTHTYSRLPYCPSLFFSECLLQKYIFNAVFKYTGNMYSMYSITHNLKYITEYESYKNTNRKKYDGAIVSEPEKGFHSDVCAVDFASLYPNCAIQYSLSDGTCFPIPPELQDQFDDNVYFKTKIQMEDYEIILLSLKDDNFVEQGCITNYLRYCLDIRNDIKQQIKLLQQSKEKKGLTEEEIQNIEAQIILLDAQQLTVKRAANGKYGLIGSYQKTIRNSNFCSAPLFAAGITKLGRDYLTQSREIAKSMGIVTIYSDTDSLYAKTSINCVEFAKIINNKLFEKYNNNNNNNSIGFRLKLAGEANYSFMYIAVKKRYACIYNSSSYCQYCLKEHNNILLKNGPDSELIANAHDFILQLWEIWKNDSQNLISFVNKELQKYILIDKPMIITNKCKHVDIYKNTAPQLSRHVANVGDHVGQQLGSVSFFNAFPEKYFLGKVHSTFVKSSFICLEKEYERIYNNYVIFAEFKNITSIFYLIDALSLVREQDVNISLEACKIFNTYMKKYVENVYELIHNWSRIHNTKVFHINPKDAFKKMNFISLYQRNGLFLSRIHGFIKHTSKTIVIPLTEYEKCYYLGNAKVEISLYDLCNIIDPRNVKISISIENIVEEIIIVSKMLNKSIDGYLYNLINIYEPSIVETLWGWYYIHHNTVLFAPYGKTLINLLKNEIQ